MSANKLKENKRLNTTDNSRKADRSNKEKLDDMLIDSESEKTKEILVTENDIRVIQNMIIDLKEYKKIIDTKLENLETLNLRSKSGGSKTGVSKSESATSKQRFITSSKVSNKSNKPDANTLTNNNNLNNNISLNNNNKGKVNTSNVSSNSKTNNINNKKENNKHKIESIVELEKEYEQSALKEEVIIQLNLDEDLTKTNCVNENIDQLSENKNPEDNKNINNSDNSNKVKAKINMDIDEDKQINYNQKFFDYKSLHNNNKEREKDLFLKRRSDEKETGVSFKRSKKNDWIRKELTDKKEDAKEEKKNKEIINLNTTLYSKNKVEIISSNSNSEDEAELVNPNKLPPNINSGTKELSLAFESQPQIKNNININLNNNFNKIDLSEDNKQSTKFAELMKLKKEQNISISKIKKQANLNKEMVNKETYALDLHTLDETYDDFYEIKPKLKKNPFIPNELKTRAYKSTGNNDKNNTTNILSVNTNKNGIVRNKKEREKMNGYKCELCEKFYDGIGEEFSENKNCHDCSRHRKNDDPNLTPKGYYDTSI